MILPGLLGPMIYPAIISVSYTHLDVYKRQGKTAALCHCRAACLTIQNRYNHAPGGAGIGTKGGGVRAVHQSIFIGVFHCTCIPSALCHICEGKISSRGFCPFRPFRIDSGIGSQGDAADSIGQFRVRIPTGKGEMCIRDSDRAMESCKTAK